jgi:hypothetical protein
MQTKSVLYAAVGAPVVAARKVSDKASELRGKMEEQTASYGKTAEKTIDSWAIEGEKIVSKVSEGKVVEEISSKVDLDQAKEQVGKLRDQLEDMLATWRHSFKPEETKPEAKVEEGKVEEKAEKTPAAKKGPAKKPAAKKPATKKPAEKKTSAAKTTKSSTAAKTSSTKSTSEKKAS